MSQRPVVTLYTRARCHLCDDVMDVLEAVQAERPFTLDVVDIDDDEALRARYTTRVPVVAVDGREVAEYRLTADALRAELARAEAHGA